MSVKKSWDKPRNRGASPEAPRGHTQSLKERRKRAKQLFFISLALLGGVLVILGFVLLWQPFMRISEVEVQGIHGEEIKEDLAPFLSGSYFFIVPKDSIVFYDEQSMRDTVLELYPDIAAASITRSGFSSIAVETIPRLESFLWCGPSVTLPLSQCYSVDALGLVFKERTDVQGTSTLSVYVPLLEGDSERPVRGVISQAGNLPVVMDMASAIQALGPEITQVEVRDDEVDLYTKGGARITYVVGSEEDALLLAASSFPTLNFKNGTISYVDLRFKGKAYVRRVGEVESPN
ncbi:MAG: hypothetical protein KBC16_03820 [Candidatus Pacebacteria bacterium]|nr:hypothetical protein [Candidatus Paceibacterota bacterium]